MKPDAPRDTADRILACAAQLYASDGLSGLSMRRVATCAGVSATAIYRHYASKEDLVAAIADIGDELLTRHLAAALEAGDPLARLRATTIAYLRFALDESQHYRVLFMVPHAELGFDDLSDGRRARLAATARFVGDRVRDCVDAGALLCDDPDDVARTLWSHCHGLVALHLVAPGRGGRAGFEAFYQRSIDRVIDASRRRARAR